MLPRSSMLRSRPAVLVAVVALSGLLLAAGLFVAYVRGGGPLPPALRFLSLQDAPGSGAAAETALRTLRLAGYDHASVGEEDGTVVVRLAVPGISTPGDVELSWQTALAVGAGAYPRADRCVAQVFSGDQALLEVRAPADAVREAGTGEDLRDDIEIVYLTESGAAR